MKLFYFQGALTENHEVLLLDDEKDETGLNGNTKTYIWDVKDLDHPVLKNTFVSEQSAIDHNQYIVGEYVYQVCRNSLCSLCVHSDIYRFTLKISIMHFN